MTVDPYGRTTRRGVLLNNRTIEMLEVAEMHWLRSFAPVVLTQGSYSTAVAASGGTHAGGGALDVRVRDLTGSQRDSIVWALRKQGFAAWHRTPSQGDWPEHIHAIAIGDKEMSPAAAQQVIDYKNGLNGLANKGPDDGPKVSWTEYRQDVDLSYYGPDKWDDADWQEFFNRAGWGYDLNNLNTDPVTKVNAKTSLEYAHQHATDADVQATKAVTGVAALGVKVGELDTKLDQVLTEVGKLQPPPV